MNVENWTLANVEERAEASSHFKIPSKKARSSLKFGDFAKLIFESKDGGERMWVCVLEVTCVLELDGRGVYYVGSLNNEPVTIDAEPGQRVKFRPHHVADIDSLDTRTSASHACH